MAITNEKVVWEGTPDARGERTRVTTQDVNGRPKVSVRRFYIDGDTGAVLPGRQGIALNTAEVEAVILALAEGANLKVTVKKS